MTPTHGERRIPPMPRSEVLVEVEWLLDAGVHPLLIADTMRRSAESIDKAARDLGNARVAAAFKAAVWDNRQRRERARARATRPQVAA